MNRYTAIKNNTFFQQMQPQFVEPFHFRSTFFDTFRQKRAFPS